MGKWCTPQKINMEPENAPLEKGRVLSFPGSPIPWKSNSFASIFQEVGERNSEFRHDFKQRFIIIQKEAPFVEMVATTSPGNS